MPRYASIKNGRVHNVVEADQDFANAEGLVLIPLSVGIGHLYENGVFTDDGFELVPDSITKRQAMLALLDAGLLSLVKTTVAAQSEEIGIYWEASTEIHRNHPVVSVVAGLISLTDAQLDDLFIAAGKK